MADFSTPWASQKPSSYYASFPRRPSLGAKFCDIDDEVNFRDYLRFLQEASTQNFVLDLGNEDAWCAVNLEKDDITTLLGAPVRIAIYELETLAKRTETNMLWDEMDQYLESRGAERDHQSESDANEYRVRGEANKQAIMTKYGVSERLQGMMCTEPVLNSKSTPDEPPGPGPSSTPSSPRQQYAHSSLRFRNSASKSLDQPRARVEDLESGTALEELKDPEEMQRIASLKDLTFAQVTNQIWHFCSVDHGLKYTCIGYNSLHTIPKVKMFNGKNLPDGKRLWSWLILFDDGTVVSIQENPYPRQAAPSVDVEQRVLKIVRRNVCSIFKGVSKQHEATSESDSLVTIRVRNFQDCSAPEQGRIKQEDSPSLLFYYIFDDWYSSYGLIAKREHAYGMSLDRLRFNMVDKPQVELVDELHWLGRRLAVLKKIYQSYDLIMWRILQRQRLLRDEARTNRPPTTLGSPLSEADLLDLRRQHTFQSDLGLSAVSDVSVGVQLSSAATARFERLLDRIKLYCLSEIDGCLAEKESLTFLNFNLIALKDSQAVERLTRITVLLAKVTILFLPVSLMTAYFSTELDGVKGVYTITEYWASFGVIIFLTIVLLVVFGVISGTVEGKMIYQPLSRKFLQTSKKIARR